MNRKTYHFICQRCKKSKRAKRESKYDYGVCAACVKREIKASNLADAHPAKNASDRMLAC